MNFRCYFSFLFCICFVGTLFSQERDSLATYSYGELNKLFSTFRYNDPKTAKLYADATLKKAIAEKNTTEEYNAYILQSKSFGYLGNLPEALTLADKCVAYAEEQQDIVFYVKAIKRKGTLYYNFGKYNEAITYYLKVDSIARITENKDYQVYANQSIASVKTVLGDHKNAAKLFSVNETILEPLKDDALYSSRYLSTIIGLCSSYTYFNIPKSEKYLSIIKEISTKSGDKDALSYYYSLKGIISYLKKEPEAAINTLHIADSLVTELGRKRNLFPIYRFQGKAYYDTGQFEKTIDVYEKIKTLRKDIKFDHFKYQEVIATLALSYDTINNIEKAIENFTLAQELVKANDTIKQAINYEIINKYDNKILQDKIDQLVIRSQKKEQQNTSLVYLSIGLVMLLIVLFIIYQKNKTNNRKKFETLVQKLEQVEEEASKKTSFKTTKEKKVPDEKITQILNSLQKFEDTHAYLHKNTSLTSVAKKLHTNTSYLSKTINTYKEQSFKNYITELRINYALQKLKNDRQFRSYSIKGISEELGFKSEGSFSRAFKAQTGIYPSYFIKNITANS
ncbi:DNA-binding transcriptional regulator SoxS [Kordia sp. SMS9]|uniref:helix-turn-helix transcriptional regulator n=1 Tax=Kordia sp. SMS9 TaxID=2282170 RepID=UPI000E0D8AB9|nr:helix-turn-helix transcriptional regulator [Kordia sp. SMS9]AXG68465.1 DNA-binding transcriptional regulator SoxS [Kordia sp. SMS9]